MRSLRVTAALAAFLVAPLLAPTVEATPRPLVHSAGRTVLADGAQRYSWPGVYFEGRFRGTAVGIVLNDAAADYDVQIDGTTVVTLVMPGQTTHWVRNLPAGVHDVRLVKRSESPWAVSEFGGFVAGPGGALLGGPRARSRQIEYIGDSYTAGYGNMSNTRECTGEEVHRTTNADLSFGALTADRLDADYQLNAFSGRGVVRNYNGGEPGTSYRTYYDRALLSVDGDVWPKPRSWRPQVVVIGLGINDFSTAINPGEAWTPESLAAAYRTAYHGFLDKIRARYGPRTYVVVTATHMSNTTALTDLTRQIVQERNAAGDNRVRHWHYDGLDYLGCHWHPSLRDHQLIADKLTAFLATLPLRW
ncbi:SGNH/GDSL hydrolase family protein [Actinophytocola sp.]|uniref:SGNH/GDSL hydrolase family protein n=1 Tax=Actinophytocola sp. TaxID=1872138 RepID=UPI002ED39EDA